MTRQKVLFIFGTRPEAIKLAPLINEMKLHKHFDGIVCITAQHRQMLDQVLHFFQITPDFDLNIMQRNQDLHQLTANIIMKVKDVIMGVKPDYVVVHGDTTTSFAAALSAFYLNTKVLHVEAGLRSNNILEPFPEEMNRILTSKIAHKHFAPTVNAQENLVKEFVKQNDILITGNTVIDALLEASDLLENYKDDEILHLENILNFNQKLILVTAHRRENFGTSFTEICNALLELANLRDDIQIVYPVHLNPNIKDPATRILGNHPRIKLISPIGYPAFVWLMKRSYFVITDSGGIQEEAPGLGKPGKGQKRLRLELLNWLEPIKQPL
jgi:UDP-N-acetylglucosamine 2-epimerase (non-hydrolysing)